MVQVSHPNGRLITAGKHSWVIRAGRYLSKNSGDDEKPFRRDPLGEQRTISSPVVVLYVAGELTAGGYQRQLHLLLSQLDRRQIYPVLAVWHYSPDQEMVSKFLDLHIPVYAVSQEGGVARRLLDFVRIVRKAQPRYLHSYCFYTNFPAWCAAMISGADGVIGSFRSDYWHEVSGTGFVRGRACARYPRHAIVNSEAAAKAIRSDTTIFRPRKIWVVPNTVDTDSFRPTASSSRPCGIPVQLLGIGRLTAVKRWGWLLSILRKLSSVNGLPDWRLTICGDGEDRAQVERQIADLGLFERVRLLGFQDDVAAWLRRSDLLLLCSSYEGSPNAVAEALSCGVPVLATDVGDVRAMVRDGLDGYVVTADDAEAFGDKLRVLIASAEMRKRMGASGRSWMLETRSARRLWEETLKIYREAGWQIP